MIQKTSKKCYTKFQEQSKQSNATLIKTINIYDPVTATPTLNHRHFFAIIIKKKFRNCRSRKCHH